MQAWDKKGKFSHWFCLSYGLMPRFSSCGISTAGGTWAAFGAAYKESLSDAQKAGVTKLTEIFYKQVQTGEKIMTLCFTSNNKKKETHEREVWLQKSQE